MFEKLRNLKPEIVDINNPRRSPDSRLHGVTTRVTTKNVMNTKHDMDLLELYSKGKLKYQDIGKVCGNCVNFYPDPNLEKHYSRLREATSYSSLVNRADNQSYTRYRTKTIQTSLSH